MAIGINEQDVWKAADALLLEGQRPTIERVRQKIGRGSPNTVQPYLDTWFKGLGARIRDPLAFSASIELPDPIAQAAKHFWEVAQSAASAEFQKAHQALENQLQRIETERLDFVAREAHYQERINTAEAIIAAAQIQLEETKQREIRALEAITELQRRHDETNAELVSARAQNETLRRGFEDERKELIGRSLQQEKHWLQEIDRLRQAGKDAEKRWSSTITSLTSRAEAAEHSCASLEAEFGKERSNYEQQVAAESARANALQGSLDEARRQLRRILAPKIRLAERRKAGKW